MVPRLRDSRVLASSGPGDTFLATYKLADPCSSSPAGRDGWLVTGVECGIRNSELAEVTFFSRDRGRFGREEGWVAPRAIPRPSTVNIGQCEFMPIYHSPIPSGSYLLVT